MRWDENLYGIISSLSLCIDWSTDRKHANDGEENFLAWIVSEMFKLWFTGRMAAKKEKNVRGVYSNPILSPTTSIQFWVLQKKTKSDNLLAKTCMIYLCCIPVISHDHSQFDTRASLDVRTFLIYALNWLRDTRLREKLTLRVINKRPRRKEKTNICQQKTKNILKSLSNLLSGKHKYLRNTQ